MPIETRRDQLLALAQIELGGLEPALQKRKPVLVDFGRLAEPLPFDGVVMEEEGAMVLFDLRRGGGVGALELILDELEMNGRDDVLGFEF